MKCKLIFKRDTANMLNETKTTILNKRNVSLYVKHFKYAKSQVFQKPWELSGWTDVYFTLLYFDYIFFVIHI